MCLASTSPPRRQQSSNKIKPTENVNSSHFGTVIVGAIVGAFAYMAATNNSLDLNNLDLSYLSMLEMKWPENMMSHELDLALAKEVGKLVLLASTYVTLTIIGATHLLRWLIMDDYLKVHSTFAKFVWMPVSEKREGRLSKRLLKKRSSTFSKEDSNPDLQMMRGEEPTSILDSMEALKIPICKESFQRNVVLTGSTGFVGSLILRDLLLHRKSICLGSVIVIVRAKRGVAAEQRKTELLSDPMFSFLTEEEKKSCVRVVEGDISEENAGLSGADLKSILDDVTVTHFIHSAASVSFIQPLPDAAASNITPTLALHGFVSKMKNKAAMFVHVSTAFVQGGSVGTRTKPLKEELYDLKGYDERKVYDSMRGDQTYAKKAMYDLGFHNTYTFSKCMAEKLIMRNASEVNTIIVRPNIVGPAMENPYETWGGAKPSTIVAASAFYLSWQWNFWSFSKHRAPVSPVDLVSRTIVVKAFSVKKTDKKRIFHAVWDLHSPDSTQFTWQQYAPILFQMGSVMGYFSRPVAYFTLLFSYRMMPQLRLPTKYFIALHRMFILFPLALLIGAMRLVRLSTKSLDKLGNYLDLPVLFYPFSSLPFYFESELVAPETLEGSRYLFCCVTTAHKFLKIKADAEKERKNKGIKVDSDVFDDFDTDCLCVGGSAHRSALPDFLWALTQPTGTYFNRMAGLMMRQILRVVCSAVTVDACAFSQLAEWIESREGPVQITVEPAYRSYFDFLVLSYVLFSVPELQLDVPFDAATEKLPILGFIAKLSKAFSLRKGVEKDPRIKEPKTGLLICLKDENDSYLVPITVDYERVEASSMMNTSKLLLMSRPLVGRIHVTATDPIPIEEAKHLMCSEL